MARLSRSITKELEIRLKELQEEKTELAERIALLERKIESFNIALEHERNRLIKRLSLFTEIESEARTSGNTSRLIKEILSDQQDWNLSRITEAVKNRGSSFGNKNPNRVIHFCLVGMKKHGLVEIVSKGVWRATPKLLESAKEESKTGETPTGNP